MARCPKADRTALNHYKQQEVRDYRMARMPELDWDYDGWADKVFKPHPVFDWLHNNLKGDWVVVEYYFHDGGEMNSYEPYSTESKLRVELDEDFEKLIAAGIIVREQFEADTETFQFQVKLDQFEDAAKEDLAKRKAKGRAGAMSLKRTNCPKAKRALFTKAQLLKDLQEAEWTPVTLPRMMRMTGSMNEVKAEHPLTGEPINNVEDNGYGSEILDADPLLDNLWETTKADGARWIITRSQTSNDRAVLDAQVWFEAKSEAVRFKLANPGVK